MPVPSLFLGCQEARAVTLTLPLLVPDMLTESGKGWPPASRESPCSAFHLKPFFLVGQLVILSHPELRDGKVIQKMMLLKDPEEMPGTPSAYSALLLGPMFSDFPHFISVMRRVLSPYRLKVVFLLRESRIWLGIMGARCNLGSTGSGFSLWFWFRKPFSLNQCLSS